MALQKTWLVGLVYVGIMGLIGPTARSDDAEVSIKVASLFKVGWKPSIQGFKAAQAEYEEAAKLAPNDVRVPFAMALVSIQNHKYKEAAKQLDEALVGSKPLLPIRRVRIYVAVMLKDYPGAAREIRTLVDHLPAEEQAGDAELPYRDHARFLGKVVEYLSQHADAKFKIGEFATLEGHLKSRLKGERLVAYEAARAESLQHSKELDEELAEKRTEAIADNKSKKEDAKKLAETRVAGFKADGDKIEAQRSAYVAANEAQRRTAEVLANQAQNDIGRLNGQLGNIDGQIANLKASIKNERAAAQQQNRRDNTRDLEQQLSRAEAEYRVVQGQRSQISAANKESIAFMKRYNADLAKFASDKEEVTDKLDKARRQENAANRMPVNDVNPTTSALGNELKAFSTYVGLSLETEKDRILATYRAK